MSQQISPFNSAFRAGAAALALALLLCAAATSQAKTKRKTKVQSCTAFITVAQVENANGGHAIQLQPPNTTSEIGPWDAGKRSTCFAVFATNAQGSTNPYPGRMGRRRGTVGSRLRSDRPAVAVAEV